MPALIVDAPFWQLFPEAKIFYLIVHGVNNQPGDPTVYQRLLDDATEKAHAFIQEEDFKTNPVVAEWRTAFTKFKKKKGARSSIEALLKRVAKGNHFTPINPLVDLYNCASLAYGVPFGGEDLDKMNGTMHLGFAQGGESFLPLGADDDEPALPNELIYYDQTGAICRSLNWRDAQRTMLTEATTNAILLAESVTPKQQIYVEAAIKSLQTALFDHLNVPSTRHSISATHAD